MKVKHLLMIAGAVASAVMIITAVVWALALRERPNPAQYGWLGDYSDSRVVDCSAVASMIKEIQASPRTMNGSYLYFFSTGDDRSSDEPVLLGRYQIPISVRVLEGQPKHERTKQAFVEQVKTRCEEEPVKKRSPIVLGLKRVIENLRSNGCDVKAGCKVFVQTDGHELSETAIKNSLNSRSRDRLGAVARIPNEGIVVKICGFAQVSRTKNQASRHSIESSEKMNAVWKELFVDPSSVIIQPHCQ